MWFRINYSVPGESTMFPLVDKVIASDAKAAKVEYIALYPSRVVHSVQPIDDDEIRLLNLVETSTN